MFTKFKKPDFNSKMHQIQKKMLPHAEAIANNNGIQLDYSLSMARIDALLEKVATEVAKEGLKTEADIRGHAGVKGISESIGLYIVEAIERNNGVGRWIDKDADTNEPMVWFRPKTGNSIYPPEWVMKKLVNPTSYSIEDTYRKFMS